MKRLKHPIRISLGVIFLILAVVGALVPILQGWIFFLLALVMFFPSHRRVEKAIRRAEPRWPRLVRLLRKLGVGDPEPSGDSETPI